MAQTADMRKGWICAAAAFVLGTAVFTGMAQGGKIDVRAEEVSANCKASYLMDDASGVQMYANNECKRLPIASMCKIMTLLLAFEAADAGDLSYEEEFAVSERAAGMGGSQVFLGVGLVYRVDELLKSIAVCSANDSCVAIAERLAGSEEAFCERMNARAKELGAENTLFANCTGLPKEPQYSCAKDVALMLRELIRHEKYHEYARIRLEDFLHPDGRTTQMTNTNKLIRSYDGCDGGKTGFTNEAGFCLAASAKRAEMRVIAVVIGSSDSKARFEVTTSLFDYAFQNFESKTYLTAGEPLENEISVRGSEVRSMKIAARSPLCVLRRRGVEENYTLHYELEDALTAPVSKGETIGYAVLLRDGVEVMRTDLVACGEAQRFTWWEAYRENARHWNIV